MGKREELIYYHALYHLVTHWAAYMGTLILLITIGMILSSSPIIKNCQYFTIVIIITGFGSLFFLWRMYTFDNIVNQKLRLAARKTMWIAHPWNLLIGGSITFIIIILDFVVLFS